MAEVGGGEVKVERSSSSQCLIDLSPTSPRLSGDSATSNGSKTDDDNSEFPSKQPLSQNEELPDRHVVPQTKLCGWLSITTHALIKPNRMRWFVFGDTTCKLYYYRNQNDFLPLGEIEISHATFHFDASNTAKPGCFEIRSEEKEYILEAPDRNLMMYWLNELQSRRRQFNQHHNIMSIDKPGHMYSTRRPVNLGGLSSATSADYKGDSNILNSPSSVSPTDPIESQKVLQPATNTPSVTNVKTEIQLTSSNFKRKSSEKRKLVRSNAANSSSEDWVMPDQSGIYEPPVNQTRPQSQGKIRSALGKLKLKKSPARSEDMPIVSPAGSICHRCKLMENELSMVKEEHQSTEDELQALREIVRLQQKELDHQRKEIDTKRESAVLDETGLAKMMTKRDKHIVELEYCLATSNEEKAVLAQQNRTVQSELSNLKEQVSMFQHMLEAKDQVIVKLTNDVFKLEQNNNNESKSMTLPSRGRSMDSVTTPVFMESNMKEIDRLKDVCRAYEDQHQFLTKEILELNELRKSDKKTLNSLSMNLAKTEAEFCQTKSKYLFLLKELKEPMRGGDQSSQDIVNQLLEDAMESDEKDSVEYHLTSSGQEYDRYGFVKKYNDDKVNESDPLLLEAQKLEKRSEEVNSRLKKADEVISHQVKWENFMVGMTDKPFVKSTELKLLVRSGVPHEHREFIWNGCVRQYVGRLREKKGPNYYKELVNKMKHVSWIDPATKQVELDLLRTLPNNKHYESVDSEGVTKLRNVLLAYNSHNPVIGYCQGMNRIVAIILLFLTEEETFWCLVAIVDYIMPKDYYSKTLVAAQADQRVLKDLILEKLPRVHSHFEMHNVDISLFTFNWFLTIFVDNIPTETFLRIWDSFLFEGSKVLFRYALAFFKIAEEDILRANGPLELNHFMRTLGEKMSNVQQISHIAFHGMNPFPMKNISSKRQIYIQHVKAELEELNRMREELKFQNDNVQSTDLFSDDEPDS